MSEKNKEKLEELKKDLANAEQDVANPAEPEQGAKDLPAVPEKKNLWVRTKEFYDEHKQPIKKWTKRTLIVGGLTVGALLGLDFLAKSSGEGEDPENCEDSSDTIPFDGEDIDVSESGDSAE